MNGNFTERYKMAASKEGLDKSLQAFILDGIVDTGPEIGKGAYGSVRKVRRWGMVCAAKKLQDLSLHFSGGENRSIVEKFKEECQLLSSLRHPYIVQFLGVYIEKGSDAPVLVMEYLPTNLATCLEKRPQIPLCLQVSILHNVALGMAYLHGHNPPIIHRDLTANNVLLANNMVSKIADLGVARMLDLNPKSPRPLTHTPGTTAYMPPEALVTNATYNTKIDCFSFGILTVHLVSQQWPIPGDAMKMVGGKPIQVAEAARRQQYLDLMGRDHKMLPLALQCMQNDATSRPEMASIAVSLEALQRKHPLPTTSYLDLLQVLESNRNQIEAKGVQLEVNKEQLQAISSRLEERDGEIKSLREKIAALEKQLAGSLKGLLLQSEPSASPQLSASKRTAHPASLLQTQSTFTWKRDANMPVGMFGARAILLDDKLYIGGGDSKEVATDRVVHEYDINGLVRKWTPLPPSPVAFFAMAEVNKSLTLVGGLDIGKKTATCHLTVWDREQQKWTTPFPHMPTPRQDPTVATYELSLLVAGGTNNKKPINNVELFDCATFHWKSIRPLPKPCVGLTSCIVNNSWHLLGGTNFIDPLRGETGPLECVYSISLDENIATNRWSVLPDSPLYCSTAVAFGEYLMSVGGTDSVSSRTHSQSMFLYSPAMEKWLFVGNMPTPRSQPTCVVLSKGRLIVLGGQERSTKYSATVELLYC